MTCLWKEFCGMTHLQMISCSFYKTCIKGKFLFYFSVFSINYRHHTAVKWSIVKASDIDDMFAHIWLDIQPSELTIVFVSIQHDTYFYRFQFILHRDSNCFPFRF